MSFATLTQVECDGESCSQSLLVESRDFEKVLEFAASQGWEERQTEAGPVDLCPKCGNGGAA